MDQAPLFRCHDCQSKKPKDQFALRQRTSLYGALGEPTSRCSSCAAKERERRKNRKRKRDEEGLDSSGGPAEPDATISLAQFTALLHEQALTGKIHCSASVSTEKLSGGDDEICAGILGRVWEATGFRFTYKTKHLRMNGTAMRVYECCQTATSSNNRPKMDPEQGKQSRDTRRMPRFPCNGLFYVTPRDGYLNCVLKHSLDHMPYKDIRIPEEWRQFIIDNHELGPTKIWREILQGTEGGKGIAFTQKSVRYAWMCESSHLSKCADDPIESARQTIGAQEDIEMVEMVPGSHSKAPTEEWAHHTDSSLVDSSDPSGFSQPLSRQELCERIETGLQNAIKMFESQQHRASEQWLDNFAEQFKPGFKFVADNLACEPPYVPKD